MSLGGGEFGEKIFYCIYKMRKDTNNDILIAIKVFEQIIISKLILIMKNFLGILGKLISKGNSSSVISTNASRNLLDEIMLNMFSQIRNT